MDYGSLEHSSVSDKLDYVWSKGKLLSYADWKHGMINLYSCGKYFAEVYYNIRHNYIEKVNLYSSVNDLDKYISRIRIPKI